MRDGETNICPLRFRLKLNFAVEKKVRQSLRELESLPWDGKIRAESALQGSHFRNKNSGNSFDESIKTKF